MSAPCSELAIATDLCDFEQGDEVDVRINGAWCPCIVIAATNFLGSDCVEVITRYPLVAERLWLPNNTQARWGRP